VSRKHQPRAFLGAGQTGLSLISRWRGLETGKIDAPKYIRSCCPTFIHGRVQRVYFMHPHAVYRNTHINLPAIAAAAATGVYLLGTVPARRRDESVSLRAGPVNQSASSPSSRRRVL